MTTAPRTFDSGHFYHVYSRGNHRDNIFRDSLDRRYFLSKLDEFCERDDVTIVAYCLMDNHFHLILRPDSRKPLATTMRSLLAGYARRYNAKYGTYGNLFQGRFSAKRVRDEGYLWHLSRYIHLNPHPFSNYKKYRWSSYLEYTTEKAGICDLGPVLDAFRGSKTSYGIYVEKSLTRGEI